MSKLLEIKSKIKFEGVDEKINERCLAWVQRPNDCFGFRYDPEDQKECGTCIVMADVDGRKEPTWVFCKELCECDQIEEDPSTNPELNNAIQEIQTQRKEKNKAKEKAKKEKPEDPIWKTKMVSLIGTMENKDLVDVISKEFDIDNRKVRLTLAGVLSSQKRRDEQPESEENQKEVTENMSAEEKAVKAESKTAMVKRLLAEGKTEDEVSAAMAALYVAEGKPEDWASKRAKGIVKLFIKANPK